MSMYLSKNLPGVLVPKYYKSVDNLVEDAFRALLKWIPIIERKSKSFSDILRDRRKSVYFEKFAIWE